ncbi:LOW QUALITY PROTEIN: carboxy-terminal kinesin 2-like [Macrochelys suwanniensis]
MNRTIKKTALRKLDTGSTHSILNSVAGNDGKKWAAWKLKGQLNDMQTKVNNYKNKVPRLDEENQQLKRQLQEQVAKQELSSQLSQLNSVLHTCQEQAQQRLHEVMEMSCLKQQLEEQVTSERRRLHNLLQELKGNIHVFCCVRPLLAWEKERQKGLEHLRSPLQDSKALVLLKGEEPECVWLQLPATGFSFCLCLIA